MSTPFYPRISEKLVGNPWEKNDGEVVIGYPLKIPAY